MTSGAYLRVPAQAVPVVPQVIPTNVDECAIVLISDRSYAPAQGGEANPPPPEGAHHVRPAADPRTRPAGRARRRGREAPLHRVMARKVQYRWPWPKVRLAVLERDGHQCQIRGPHCTSRATHVDHIIPVARGGARLEEANLRAACETCNLELSRNARRPLVTPSRVW